MKPIKILLGLLASVCLCPSFVSGEEIPPDMVWMRGGGGGGAYDVSFSPDGQTLASSSGNIDSLLASSGGNIKLWRVSDGMLIDMLSTGSTGSVCSVSFSPDGQTLASGNGDNSIQLWRVSDGSLIRKLTGHTSRVIPN